MSMNTQLQPIKAEKSSKMSVFMCITMAIGAIIGAGIFSMTPMAIGIVGKGVIISFLAAGLFVAIRNLPMIMLGSALPATGSSYVYISRMVHPILGHVQVLNSLIGTLNLAVMSLTFSLSLKTLLPNLNTTLVAILCCVTLAVVATFGAKMSGMLQNIIVGILVIAIGSYIVVGFPLVSATNMTFAEVFDNGAKIGQIWAAVALLNYTLQGGNIVMSFAEEVDNPGKAIPLSFFVATAVVAGIYALFAFVTLGVVPASSIKTIAGVAETFMSPSMLAFFITGGALLGTLTTLNGSFMIYSRIHFAAARDGIWPQFFMKTNKYKVPFVTLWACTALAVVVMITNIQLNDILAIVAVPGLVLAPIFYIPCLLLPLKFPNCYKNAWFKLPIWLNWVLSIGSAFLSVWMGKSLFDRMQPKHYIGMIIFYAIGFAYWFFRVKFLKENKGMDLVAHMKQPVPMWAEKEQNFKG